MMIYPRVLLSTILISTYNVNGLANVRVMILAQILQFYSIRRLIKLDNIVAVSKLGPQPHSNALLYTICDVIPFTLIVVVQQACR